MCVNKAKKLIYIVLIVSIILIGGTIYYHEYVVSHSSPNITANVSLSVDSTQLPHQLLINISADINSTNSLTHFNFGENTYIEGINLIYGGTNYSQAVNMSRGTYIPPPSFPQLYGLIHFTISNGKPTVSELWNLSVYNFTSRTFTNAPEGYYYVASSIVGSSNQSAVLHMNLPRAIIRIGSDGVSVIGV